MIGDTILVWEKGIWQGMNSKKTVQLNWWFLLLGDMKCTLYVRETLSAQCYGCVYHVYSRKNCEYSRNIIITVQDILHCESRCSCALGKWIHNWIIQNLTLLTNCTLIILKYLWRFQKKDVQNIFTLFDRFNRDINSSFMKVVSYVNMMNIIQIIVKKVPNQKPTFRFFSFAEIEYQHDVWPV